jgi:hypothetical protein
MVEGLFTVLICIPCLEVRQAQPATRLSLHDPGPYPVMTPAEMGESLALLPSWVLAQKAAANRQLIAVTRERLAAGEQVARMYQEPGPDGRPNRRPSDYESTYESTSLRPAGAIQTRSGYSRRRGRPASAFLTCRVMAGGMTKRMTRPTHGRRTRP